MLWGYYTTEIIVSSKNRLPGPISFLRVLEASVVKITRDVDKVIWSREIKTNELFLWTIQIL